MLATTIERHDGRSLRVAHLGSGPPLVLLHGYPDNLQVFSALAPRLATRFRIIAFDWPGMGYSEEWPGGASPVHMAERLIKLLDAWKVDSANVFGMDMGGQAAIVAAAKFPERVRRLVVSNSLVFWNAATSWEIRVLRRFGWNRFVIGELPSLVFRRAERTFLPRGLRLDRELREDFWRAFSQPSIRRFITRMCAAYQGYLPRLPELLPDIRCPTLALWAERDRHFGLEHATRLQAGIRGAKLAVVPSAEHWVVWHQAESVERALSPFLTD